MYNAPLMFKERLMFKEQLSVSGELLRELLRILDRGFRRGAPDEAAHLLSAAADALFDAAADGLAGEDDGVVQVVVLRAGARNALLVLAFLLVVLRMVLRVQHLVHEVAEVGSALSDRCRFFRRLKSRIKSIGHLQLDTKHPSRKKAHLAFKALLNAAVAQVEEVGEHLRVYTTLILSEARAH